MTEKRLQIAGTRLLGLAVFLVFLPLGFWELYEFDRPRFLNTLPLFTLDWIIATFGFVRFTESD